MVARRTTISYADYSGGDLNFVIRGKNCPISDGCLHCYVERDFARWNREMGLTTQIYPEKLERLRKITLDPKGTPYRRGPDSKPILFACDYGDLFHNDVPTQFIHHAIDIMGELEGADWVLFTKRAHGMMTTTTFYEACYGLWPPNIWCVVTTEHQRSLEKHIDDLLGVPASILGLSVEPMLGPLDLKKALHKRNKQPNWVACGAESGPDRREFKIEWAESLYDQCKELGIAFFGKQDSGMRPGTPLFIYGCEVKEFPNVG